jgi:hypothetical protein
MDDRSGPVPTTAGILARLRTGGATALRVFGEPFWIVGRAPSGVEFELHYWPTQGYSVTRRPVPDQLVQLVGLFPRWEDAVDQALQA